MAPHLLFNIHTEQEWNEHLIPKLRLLISITDYPGNNGEMVVVGGDDMTITYLSLENNIVQWTSVTGSRFHRQFYDFYLLDDEDRLLFEKTQYLRDLYNEIFKL